MKSRTQRQLTPDVLGSLVREAFGPGVRLIGHRELTDGMFNTAYRLTLDPVGEVVLKVAPPPGMDLLTYERDLMRTEALFYALAGGTGAPLPPLLHAGLERIVIDGDYLFLGALCGRPAERAAATLTAHDRRAYRRRLGSVVAALHTVTGDRWGYPHCELTGPTWRAAFLTMAAAVVDDAKRFGVTLPPVIRRFERHAAALDEVRTPVLTHFDLWDGNIFLEGSRITGIIDAERAFWGDPHADFVSLSLFGQIEQDTDFLAGYRDAGGRVEFTDALRTRLALYRIYLYLIMVVEGVPRGYGGSSHSAMRTFCRGQLDEELRSL